ncbi:MAG: hypothetical protein OHK0018_00630 [Erythrobacter tepidarius]
MQKKPLWAVFAAASIMTVQATAPLPALAQSAALPTSGQFWACDPGFTLQTSGNAARCIKSGERVETYPGNCVLPSQKRIRGQVDACVAGPIAGDMVCLDPTTRIEVRCGIDVCVKNTQPTIRQPASRITRS